MGLDTSKAWENLNAAVIVSDADFNVIFANTKAFQLLEKLDIRRAGNREKYGCLS